MPNSAKLKPLIFISHSAKDAKAKAVLRKLYRTLRRDFEVLLDRERLQGGDDWRRELHTWMGLCDGAVVILSEDALCESPWVHREATILGYRNEDEKDFVLVPVLVPPVTPERVRESKSFSPVNFGAVQAVEGSPEKIAREVSAALQTLRGIEGRQTALQRVEEKVAGILRTEVEARWENPKQKFDAAAATMGKRVRWKTGRTYSAQFARHLMSTSLEKSTKALVSLTENFNDKEKAEKILDDYLRPFWVNPEAVTELARMNKRPRGERAVGVNGSDYPDTSEDYVLRACGVIREWVYVKINGKGFEDDGTFDAAQKNLENEILRQVAPKIGFRKDQLPSNKAVEDELYLLEDEQPFFILVPTDFDEELVEWLRVRFKPFTFFFLHGEQPPTTEALAGKHIILLKPELKAGQEQEVGRLIRRARGEITRTR